MRLVSEQSEFFTVPALKGVRLHALFWGDRSRPIVVLLHGGGANAHWWDHLAAPLSDRYCAVALDFRGHGDSDHPAELTVGAFNHDLEALLGYLKSPPIALVGHSMGGHVALDHASHHPETSSAVLIDILRGASKRSRRSARLALTLRRTYATRADAARRFRFFPPAPHAEETLRAAIAEHSLREEADGRYGFAFDPRWFTVPSRPPPEPSAVRCPVLILRGSESELLTSEGAQALQEELPEGRLVEIEGAGHQTHIEKPEAVLKALRDFLSEIE